MKQVKEWCLNGDVLCLGDTGVEWTPIRKQSLRSIVDTLRKEMPVFKSEAVRGECGSYHTTDIYGLSLSKEGVYLQVGRCEILINEDMIEELLK